MNGAQIRFDIKESGSVIAFRILLSVSDANDLLAMMFPTGDPL